MTKVELQLALKVLACASSTGSRRTTALSELQEYSSTQAHEALHRCRTLSTASYTSRHCYELEKLSQNASRTKHTVIYSAQIKFRGAAPPTKYDRLTG